MSLLEYTPDWNAASVETLVARLYGISTTATPLPSERDQNFLLQTEGSEKFVLKIANALESEELLQAQTQVLHHLALQLRPQQFVVLFGPGRSQRCQPDPFERIVDVDRQRH